MMFHVKATTSTLVERTERFENVSIVSSTSDLNVDSMDDSDARSTESDSQYECFGGAAKAIEKSKMLKRPFKKKVFQTTSKFRKMDVGTLGGRLTGPLGETPPPMERLGVGIETMKTQVGKFGDIVEETLDTTGIKGRLEHTLSSVMHGKYFHRSAKLSETNKKLKSQIWSSVVTIVLVEGKNIGLHHPGVQYSSSSKDDTTICPGVKFRLGNGKYKSKCAQRTCNPLWREQVDLHMFDDQSKILEITVYDGNRIREEIIGRCTIDLNELEHEKTLGLWKELHDGNGSIHLLLTISGTTQSETISDLTNYEFNPKEREAIVNRYNLYSTFNNLKDIGHVTVKVFKAQNLAAADIGGKSDPFCVLELVNARLQTQTEYKTLSPSWQKIFTFNVKDIHSVLEVTVYDEDRDHKVEFLGKVEIPLLRIQNGERKWYQLKDKKLHGRVKGQILLEMEVAYNSIRSCIRTFNPKEEKYMEQEEKFKRQVFVNNVLRVREMIRFFIDGANFIQSCWEWESPIRSCVTFVIFLVVTYNFQMYMFPMAFLLIFLRVNIARTFRPHSEEDDEEKYFDDDDDEDKDKEEKKTLKEKLQAVQEVALTVQVALGKVASVWESIKKYLKLYS
ncbi:hypothetical protein CHUAL_009020 [Chamberlinius hualienensis]